MVFHKKRFFVLCLLFLMLLSFSYAANSDKKLYDDYVYEQDDLLLDGNTLPVSILLTPNKARVTLSDEVYLLDYGTTKDTGFYEISIGSYIADSCDSFEEGKYCKVRSGSLDGGEAITNLYILKKSPDLDISYELLGEEMFVGSTQKATLTITNKGSIDLYDISFYDKYPWELFLKNPSVGAIVDNTVTYERSVLRAGEAATLTFEIEIRDPSDTTQTGKLTFSNGVLTQSATVDPIHIQTVSPLGFAFEFAKPFKDTEKTLEVDTLYDFDLIVTSNTGTPTTYTDLTFTFPKTFVIKDFELDLVNNKSVYTGVISDDKIFEGVATLDATSTVVQISYVYDGDLYKDSYTISAKSPVVETDLTKISVTYTPTHKSIYIPNNRESYSIWLKNTGETSLSNIRGSVETELFDEGDFYIASLRPEQSVFLFEHTYTTPEVTQKTSYAIDSKFSYFVGDDEFEVTHSESVDVIPLLEAISHKTTVNKLSDFEHSVSGSITSILPYNVYIDMQLVHSLGRYIISDKSQYSIQASKLEPKETRQLFSYTILIPDGVTETIDTSFWANDVLAKDTVSVSGNAGKTTQTAAMKVTVANPDSLSVGEKDKIRIIIENPTSNTDFQNIIFDFLPSSSVSVETPGRERLRDMVAQERYTKEIPFTLLKPGNTSLGRLVITYVSEDGEPFVFAKTELPIEGIGQIGDAVEPLYVEGNVTVLEETGADELIRVVLQNPTSSQITGSFFIANKSIDFTLEPAMLTDFYYTVSHSESLALQKSGLVVQTAQADTSSLQQVLSTSSSITQSGNSPVIIQPTSDTDETSIVLVSDEGANDAEFQSTLIVTIIIALGVLALLVALVNIYKKKRSLRI